MISLNPSEGVWEGLEQGSARPCGQPAFVLRIEPQERLAASRFNQARDHSCPDCGFIWEACDCDMPPYRGAFYTQGRY